MTTRSEVEDLLYLEADLLDAWKLKDWLALYTEDAEYEVPSADLPGDADPATSLFYIADDRFRLEEGGAFEQEDDVVRIPPIEDAASGDERPPYGLGEW